MQLEVCMRQIHACTGSCIWFNSQQSDSKRQLGVMVYAVGGVYEADRGSCLRGPDSAASP